MKKLILSICLSLLLAVGCANLPAPTNLQIVTKPDYIQRMEAIYPVEIIRYENDGKTLWVWVDNKTMPGSCDYVVVYGLIDLDNDQVVLLSLYNTEMFEDPCSKASTDYDEYTHILDRMEKEEVDVDHSINPEANEI